MTKKSKILLSYTSDNYGTPSLPLGDRSPSNTMVTVSNGQSVPKIRAGTLKLPTLPSHIRIRIHAVTGFTELLLYVSQLGLNHDILVRGATSICIYSYPLSQLVHSSPQKLLKTESTISTNHAQLHSRCSPVSLIPRLHLSL